jgi:hypothetical protein
VSLDLRTHNPVGCTVGTYTPSELFGFEAKPSPPLPQQLKLVMAPYNDLCRYIGVNCAPRIGIAASRTVKLFDGAGNCAAQVYSHATAWNQFRLFDTF